jgi:hypothetical protein
MIAATNQDIPEVMAALRKLWAKSSATHMSMVDPMQAELSVRHAQHTGRLWLYGPYAIMVDHGQDWYSSKKFLIEQIIVRYRPTMAGESHTIEHVIGRALPFLRDHFGCQSIIVGDSQVGYMVPHYEAAGYKHVGVQLMKEKP